MPGWRNFLEGRIADGTKVAVCTDGASGLVASGGWVDIEADPVDTLVYTNGASDAFFAGFSVTWTAGLGLESSMARGTSVAAAALQSPDLAP